MTPSRLVLAVLLLVPLAAAGAETPAPSPAATASPGLAWIRPEDKPSFHRRSATLQTRPAGCQSQTRSRAAVARPPRTERAGHQANSHRQSSIAAGRSLRGEAARVEKAHGQSHRPTVDSDQNRTSGLMAIRVLAWFG